jgi:lipoprotein-releasing system permease protein
MYQSLLVARYLSSRVIPFIAVAAVALCVALVIVVVSVMSGFLDMVRNSGRTLVGDVVLSWDIVGIPDYPELIAELEKRPEVEAASPVIETFGLLRMPYRMPGGGNKIETVQVWGVEPESLARVVDFRELLYWKAPTAEEAAAMMPDDPRLEEAYDAEADAMAMRKPDGSPGIILGIEISPFNRRQKDGSYRTTGRLSDEQDAGHWMPSEPTGVVLTLVPVSESGSIDVEKKRPFKIVNEFRTGVYQIDSQRVLIPLAEAQEMLRLAPAPLYARDGELDESGRPKRLGTSPARATTILVKAAAGFTPDQARDAVELAYADWTRRAYDDPARLVKPPPGAFAMTWEERLQDLIGPVEKERGLMQVLFSLVYIVCAGLVLAIFWSIVQEKTRDIGILRAVGASRTGILLIFLVYGLVIGTLGSLGGFGLSTLVVGRINEIHALIGQPAPAVLWGGIYALAAASLLAATVATVRGSFLSSLLWIIGTLLLGGLGFILSQHRGILIWDPSVYYFSRIPNEVDLRNALFTMGFATLFSVIGAAVPAARAADTDPIRSLRYE